MLSKNHPIILFIDRFGFSIYQDTLTNIPKFNFTPDLVSNLDVVNNEQFAGLISTFIQINKIIGSSLAVILSDNVIYVKDLVSPAQKSAPAAGLKTDSSEDKEHQGEVQSFLEDVPFEEVLAKVIKTGNVSRIVAVNRGLVMAIIDAFKGKGSVVESITPGFMFGQSANFTVGLTSDNIRVVLGNAEILRLGNLLTDSEKMIPSQDLESELIIPSNMTKSDLGSSGKKPQSRRQYVLVGVFVILLVILGVVYFTMGASQKLPPSYKIKANVPSAAVPTVPPAGGPTAAQAVITTVPVDLKTIKIKIVSSSLADTKAADLQSGLLKIGLMDVVNEVSEVSIQERSSVVFSQNIPADLRNNISIEIKKILPSVTVLENQDPDFTVNILIGKS